MPYYNLTNVSASNNLWELTSAVNTVSGGWLGTALLITFSVIVFIALKNYPMKEAFVATAFISVVIAMLLRTLSLIGDFAMFIYVIIAGAALLTLIFNK